MSLTRVTCGVEAFEHQGQGYCRCIETKNVRPFRRSSSDVGDVGGIKPCKCGQNRRSVAGVGEAVAETN